MHLLEPTSIVVESTTFKAKSKPWVSEAKAKTESQKYKDLAEAKATVSKANYSIIHIHMYACKTKL